MANSTRGSAQRAEAAKGKRSGAALRRANPGETEREREGKRDLRLHYLGAKLLEGLKSTRSGGTASSRSSKQLQQWRRRKLGLERGEGSGCSSMGSRGCGASFI